MVEGWWKGGGRVVEGWWKGGGRVVNFIFVILVFKWPQGQRREHCARVISMFAEYE
jgi:hypothetical protein